MNTYIYVQYNMRHVYVFSGKCHQCICPHNHVNVARLPFVSRSRGRNHTAGGVDHSHSYCKVSVSLTKYIEVLLIYITTF